MPPLRTSKPITWRQKKQFIKNSKWKKTEKFLKSQTEQKNVEAVIEETTRSIDFLKTAPSLSVAVPGSILDNAQSDQLRSYLAGQIARAACIYNISELIVYDDTCDYEQNYGYGSSWESCKQLAKILEYLECPQYLRKYLFPMCDELKYAGLLNPLDAPHHLRATDQCPFSQRRQVCLGVWSQLIICWIFLDLGLIQLICAALEFYERDAEALICDWTAFYEEEEESEGVTTGKVSTSGTKSFADIGLPDPVKINKLLPENTRVTLSLHRSKKENTLKGKVVSEREPTVEAGLYWGYKVRLAKRLSDVFTESSFEEDYDLSIGTSDKGEPWPQLSLPEPGSFKRVLIVFGGVRGLEYALSNDEKLSSVDNVSHLFEAYVNTCPSQGARTIRTEEAILISLAVLTPKLGFT